MNISITIDVACGADITNTCTEAIRLATNLGINIHFVFNDKQIIVFPYTNLDSLILAYKEAQRDNCEFVSTLDRKI